MASVARWSEFVKEMKATNSRLLKQEVVKRYDDLTALWRLIYSPNMTTGITSKSIHKFYSQRAQKRRKLDASEYTLESLMSALCSRELTGHAALETVCGFLDNYSSCKDDLIMVFDGPKLGIDLDQMNKALHAANKPIVCPVFEVCLAHPFQAKYFDESSDWYVSRKFDGVRVIVRINERQVTVSTRYGTPLFSLHSVFEEVRQRMLPWHQDWPHSDLVLDGEACIMTGDTEDFAQAVSRFRKLEPMTQDFRINFIDVLSGTEFDDRAGTATYSERLNHLQKLISTLNDPRFKVIEVEKYSTDVLTRWNVRKAAGNWEGLMLRKDAPYVGRRTNDLLKIKTFHTAEYVVKDITVSKKQMLNSSGVMVEVPIMGSAMIQHKGSFVGVGSGFTDDQREFYFKFPELIIGNTIEVQYFEETQSKNGAWSLRFPTVKNIWGVQRTM